MIGPKEQFNVDLNDEVVRGTIVLHQGRMMWPPPVISSPPPSPTLAKKIEEKAVVEVPLSPLQQTFKSAAIYTAGNLNFS